VAGFCEHGSEPASSIKKAGSCLFQRISCIWEYVRQKQYCIEEDTADRYQADEQWILQLESQGLHRARKATRAGNKYFKCIYR